MFGRMMVTPILQVGRDADLQTAMTSVLQATEQAEIVRWIEFPNSVLLFLLVPGDPESGAIYTLDRKTRTWYSVDFDDRQYGGSDKVLSLRISVLAADHGLHDLASNQPPEFGWAQFEN